MKSLYEKYGPKPQQQYSQNQMPSGNPMMSGPFSYYQNAVNRARQIMQTLKNPQQFVLQNFGNVPNEILNDPDQIVRYLQQNNRLTQEQLQFLNMFHRG